MDDQLNLLQQIANDAGPLLHVSYVTWSELPNDKISYLLTFQNLELTVSACDDDTVELIQGRSVHETDCCLRVCEDLPWSEAIGKPLRWGWVMTNQQGYEDAVQFEFARNVSEPATTVQIVALSSSLKIFLVQETRELIHETLIGIKEK